jgi:hypothetical protein
LAVRKTAVRPRETRALGVLASIASRDPRFVTIGRNAPQSRRETAAIDHVFPKNGRRIFFARPLDRANPIDPARKIRVSARDFFERWLRGDRAKWRAAVFIFSAAKDAKICAPFADFGAGAPR